MIRTFHHEDFDVDDLARVKRADDLRVSVCVPARDEAATIGPIVRTVVDELVEGAGLVDEVLVLDDRSADATAAEARAAGATVFSAAEVLPELGPGAGKGEAMWKSVAASRGDLVAWVDGDITDFGARFVVGLLGPLLTRPEVAFVKGYYDRPIGEQGEGGGRVTELVARPLVSILFPQLASIVQPLAGEYAGRRATLERLPFVQGYGVDIGLLVDVATIEGIESLAQVDLGTRRHRNRPLRDLGPQALEVMQTALRRAGTGLADQAAVLARPGEPPLEVHGTERPPLLEVPGYRRRSA